jgi:hypothetical protein
METAPDNELGGMLMLLADRIKGHSNFRNYNESLKDDMKSFALYKMVRGLRTVKCGTCSEADSKRVFNYFTRACFNAYLTVIGRHYKQMNIKRDLTEAYISQLAGYAPQQAA